MYSSTLRGLVSRWWKSRRRETKRAQVQVALRLEHFEPRRTLDASLNLIEINSIVGSAPSSIVPTSLGSFFAANDILLGNELYKSDGTAGGTTLVRDIEPGGFSSFPGQFTQVGGTVFFTATTGNRGTELWKTDGTSFGTSLVKDINPGSDSSNPGELTAVKGLLYFTADDGTSGRELWKSDGTLQGTVRVRDIIPGAASSSPEYLEAVNDVLVFAATSTTGGREIWRSNGTVSGTTQLKDIVPGPDGSIPENLTSINSQVVYFSAFDADLGQELWKTDGTAAGTVLVKDIDTGTGNSAPIGFTALGNTVYFSAFTSSAGRELWRTNGTEQSTTLVKDINPGPDSSFISNPVAAGATGYFVAFTPDNGSELWKTNGTESGTVIVRDLVVGAAGSYPDGLTFLNGNLYFGANSSTLGRELFRSNGFATGTSLLYDIYPGVFGSNPFSLVAQGDKLLFSADNGVNDTELYALDTKPTVVIDNGGTGYSETGTWFTSSLKGFENSSSRFSGTPSATATWSATSLTPGYYKVELFKVLNPNNAASANVEVVSVEGTKTQAMNFQGSSPSGWAQLGIFEFNGGAAQRVRLSNASGTGTLRADAVRFTPVAAPITIDFGSPGYVETGTWGASSLIGNAGTTSRFSTSPSAVVNYRPALKSGTYTVQVYVVRSSNSTTNAIASVGSNAGTNTFSINQATGTSGWVTLGTFAFDGVGPEFVSLRNGNSTGALRADAVRFLLS